MNFADIFIIIVIAVPFIRLIMAFRKKDKGCCGCCDKCSGCMFGSLYRESDEKQGKH